jgi:hypothetical protein
MMADVQATINARQKAAAVADSKQQAANSRQQTANSRQQTAGIRHQQQQRYQQQQQQHATTVAILKPHQCLTTHLHYS